jgi:hypothetical protein
VGAFSSPSGAQPLVHVLPGDLGRLGFDHESERITQRLAEERTGEPF